MTVNDIFLSIESMVSSADEIADFMVHQYLKKEALLKKIQKQQDILFKHLKERKLIDPEDQIKIEQWEDDFHMNYMLFPTPRYFQKAEKCIHQKQCIIQKYLEENSTLKDQIAPSEEV